MSNVEKFYRIIKNNDVLPGDNTSSQAVISAINILFSLDLGPNQTRNEFTQVPEVWDENDPRGAVFANQKNLKGIYPQAHYLEIDGVYRPVAASILDVERMLIEHFTDIEANRQPNIFVTYRPYKDGKQAGNKIVIVEPLREGINHLAPNLIKTETAGRAMFYYSTNLKNIQKARL